MISEGIFVKLTMNNLSAIFSAIFILLKVANLNESPHSAVTTFSRRNFTNSLDRVDVSKIIAKFLKNVV